MIERRAGLDQDARAHLIQDAGGIQPYVWWLGLGLMALAIGAGLMETPAPLPSPSTGSPA